MLSRYRRLRRGPAAKRAAVHPPTSGPAISLVMPTYESDASYLREAIESVRRQDHQAWELCIADDGSRGGQVRRELERARSADPRVKVRYLEENAGIAAASNAGLELATGEFVGFLDHDDVLTPDALATVAEALTEGPELDVVYSDQDKLTAHGRRADPFFKPDWSPVYALGAMYIGHLLVVRRSLAGAVGGFDPAFDKIQDFEFLLRVSERTDRIHHIPRILYHWRAIPGSIAAGAEQKAGVEELQAAAVSAHLERSGAAARVVPHPAIPHRARLVRAADESKAVASQPMISVIVVGNGSVGPERLLASLGEHAGSVEAVVVDPQEGGTPFNRARAANAGAARASAPWLLFCDPAVEIASPGWVDSLAAHAAIPEVVAVGPLLIRPDGRTAAAGIALGLERPAMPMLPGLDADEDGYYGALCCARDVAAVSGRAMAVDAAAFAAAGGFSEHFHGEYEDFDLCQRLRQAGGRVVYAPLPRLIDHEPPAAAAARADVIDRALFVDRWYDDLAEGDPFYNPNFDRTSASFGFRHDYAKAAG
jgi:GT2 family glycosyltransferase